MVFSFEGAFTPTHEGTISLPSDVDIVSSHLDDERLWVQLDNNTVFVYHLLNKRKGEELGSLKWFS